MVGGLVIGIVRRLGEPTLLHIQDETYTNECCCVRVLEEEISILLGDGVWWHGDTLHWSAREHGSSTPLVRVGGSFSA